MIDITRNAVWTEDCGGKMDLDFPFIDCDTRYWADNTCKCHIRLCSGVYLYREHTLHEPFDTITIIESDYIEGNSKEECQMKARQWYNEHAVQALELAILMITENVEVHRKGDLYYVCISFGENYYKTDSYSKREYALSEAKGYLEGLAIKLEAELNNIDMQLTKEE